MSKSIDEFSIIYLSRSCLITIDADVDVILRIPSTEVLCERNDMCLSHIKPNDCAAAVQTKAAALVAMAARAAAVHGIQITAKQKYTYIYTSHARIRYRS